MASLKELRDRKESVRGTQKITRAMQMVAAAKLRRAKERAENARPYTQKLLHTVSELAQTVDATDAPRLLKGTGKQDSYLLIICTADRGLCGAFNSQIVRFAERKIKDLLAEGRDVKLLTVGKKGADSLRRNYGHLILEEISFREIKQIGYQEAADLKDKIISLFNKQAFDVCQLIYSEFRSVLNQIPTSLQLIPLVGNAVAGDVSFNSDTVEKAEFIYDYEPSSKQVLTQLVPGNIAAQIFSALLENVAGEMGAKMRAMDNATRNAGEMINKLSVTYNRQRQAKITTELIEIISGAEAL